MSELVHYRSYCCSFLLFFFKSCLFSLFSHYNTPLLYISLHLENRYIHEFQSEIPLYAINNYQPFIIFEEFWRIILSRHGPYFPYLGIMINLLVNFIKTKEQTYKMSERSPFTKTICHQWRMTTDNNSYRTCPERLLLYYTRWVLKPYSVTCKV